MSLDDWRFGMAIVALGFAICSTTDYFLGKVFGHTDILDED